MLAFSIGIIIVVLIGSLIERKIYVAVLGLISGCIAMTYNLFQYILNFFGDHWIYRLGIPAMLTIGLAFALSKPIDKIIEKLK